MLKVIMSYVYALANSFHIPNWLGKCWHGQLKCKTMAHFACITVASADLCRFRALLRLQTLTLCRRH